MFVGLGDAERRLLLIIRPGVPLTVTDAKRINPETDHRTHRVAAVLKQPHNRIHALDHFLDAHSLYGDERDRARDWR